MSGVEGPTGFEYGNPLGFLSPTGNTDRRTGADGALAILEFVGTVGFLRVAVTAQHDLTANDSRLTVGTIDAF